MSLATEGAKQNRKNQVGGHPPDPAVLLRAFEQSPEAIVITDANNRIVGANQAFSELTGYGVDEVLGENPKFLSSGHASPELYAQMWQALDSNGFWEGEIWDKRKDGSTYPKWLSISAIRDENGAV